MALFARCLEFGIFRAECVYVLLSIGILRCLENLVLLLAIKNGVKGPRTS